MPSPSRTLVEEVVAQTPADPHRYDWRNDAFSLELGYGNISEFNSFRSESYQLGVMAPELLERIACRRGSPVLAAGCESSVPGLHFAGASAVGIGYAGFRNPTALVQIIDDLEAWCDERGIKKVTELIGAVKDADMESDTLVAASVGV